MRHRVFWFCALFALLLVLTSAACSRGKPNFSGTWVDITGTPPAGAPNNPDLEVRMTIQQNATTLSATTLVFSKSKPSEGSKLAPIIFSLDGVEHRDKDGSASKASWQGDSLVLMNTRPGPGGVVTTTANYWSLDPNGQLVIEHTRAQSGDEHTSKLKSILKKLPDSETEPK